MRISDWSSDVCSSDLFDERARGKSTSTLTGWVQDLADALTQRRQYLLLEPGMFLEPAIIERTRMRQRHDRRMFAPRAHQLGQGPAVTRKVRELCVAADHQRQLPARQMRHQPENGRT